MKYFIYFLPFILLLGSCQSERNPGSLKEVINIDLTESVESQGPAKEWLDDLIFIPLETKFGCYISSVMRFDLDDKHIVVTSNERIILFDRTGKLINSFGHQGRGPGEYTEIRDVHLMPGKDEILVVSKDQRILIYDFLGNSTADINGMFIRSNVIPLSGDLFASYLGKLASIQPSQIIIFNRGGDILSNYLPFKFTMNMVSAISFVNSERKDVYYINPAYCYDIYQVGPGDSFVKKYSFNIGDSGVDTDIMNSENIRSDRDIYKQFGPKFTELSMLTITSNTFSFNGPIMKTKIKTGKRFINRETGHVKFMEWDSLGHYGYLEGFPIGLERSSFGEYFIAIKEAIDILDVMDKLNTDQVKALSRYQGFNSIKSLTENDNPVLVLYKVKDF